MGQCTGAMKDGQAAIEIPMHANRDADEMTTMHTRRDLQGQPLESHTVVITDSTLILLTEDVVERPPYPGHEGTPWLLGRLLELRVEGGLVDRREVPIGGRW